MERVYFNMYLTMKHYEQMKYQPAYMPFNCPPRDQEIPDLATCCDCTRETPNRGEFKTEFTADDIDERLVGIKRNVRDVDTKMDDVESQSSNDSREDTSVCSYNERIRDSSPEAHERLGGQDERNARNISQSKSSGHTDFSIERILSGDSSFKPKSFRFGQSEDQSSEFDWLSCTRYKPPKIHRLRRKEAPKKRTPGCNPRIPFSEGTLRCMEAKYQENPYITGDNLRDFARSIDVSKERVVVWFQNRRARQRREEESRQPDNRRRHRTGSSSSN